MSNQRWTINGDPGGNTGGFSDPWNSIISTLAGVAADDSVLCYDGGSGEILSSVPTASISGAKGSKIILTATNPSFVKDGTRYILNGNSAVANCLDMSSFDHYTWEGFDFTASTSDGYTSNGATNNTFINDRFYSNGGHGANISGNGCIWSQCRFYSNTGMAFTAAQYGYYEYCDFYLNGNSIGTIPAINSTMYRCLWYDNAYAATRLNANVSLIGCIIDDHIDGVWDTAGDKTVINCIFSNITDTAFNFTSGLTRAVNVAYYNVNTKIDTVTNYEEVSPDVNLLVDPFANQAGRDYTYSISNADLVGVEKIIDSNNSSFETYGFCPEYPTSTAPTGGAILTCYPTSSGLFKITRDTVTGSETGTNIYMKATSGVFSGGVLAGMMPPGQSTAYVAVSSEGARLIAGGAWYIGTVPINNSAEATSPSIELYQGVVGSGADQIIRLGP